MHHTAGTRGQTDVMHVDMKLSEEDGFPLGEQAHRGVFFSGCGVMKERASHRLHSGLE